MNSGSFKIELPHGPPPVLPDLLRQFEEYLTSPEKLPLHNNKNDFKFWNREVNLHSLYDIDLSPALTTLKISRDLNTGKLLDFYEVPIDGVGETTKNSTSFSRPPGRVTDDILGNQTNCPFWPGGLDQSVFTETHDFESNFDAEFLSHAPGLSAAADFSSEDRNCLKNLEESEKCDTINFQNIMEDFGLPVLSNEQTETKDEIAILPHELEENVIPKEVITPVLKTSSASTAVTAKTQWAELLDTTKLVANFAKKIPEPAVKFDFELDTFQKLAILKLENHEHIFVAAHTSAGKTVVAEYAIGLSMMRGTKTIYTSPIKALSNQKYRDFKKKFHQVGEIGLITGDFQVNQQAPCLIMTTEILRSMLYAGSDVVRDIEFVIFDEVHYINDSERGHVWEEIMIMLPDTVCIVMLSATVPNVLEFADWVGSTKKAKMFVVSTYKRPVPLEHFLYTGMESQRENLFLIKHAEGPFIVEGYNKAVGSLQKSKIDVKGEKKIVKSTGHKFISEKPYLIAFVKFLKKSDKLPAVAFTLSRSKCDKNAELLMSIDLTDETEKSFIHYFFKKSIATLKEDDRNLPQIQKMELLLLRGIAVHHSGILPLLKEIVEILFQKSLVKFLFATETFAMGVNMPAKTVAFDSIKKYDGTCTRYLEPAEYIQMAGRAGRRGTDDTGTVIILCKNNLEELEHLKNMMTGPPTKLESQFRMTYSMILNLLRVKRMRVEDIMLHSFKELHSRRKMKSYEKELADLRMEINRSQIKDKPFYFQLKKFYIAASDYIETWDSYGVKIFSNPQLRRELLSPSRIIVITHQLHVNKLALILQVIEKRDGVEFKVLILCNAEDEIHIKEADLFHRMVGLARKTIFVPDAQSKELLLTIGLESIKEITKFQLKIRCDSVFTGYKERQLQARLQDEAAKKVYQRAVCELSNRSYSIQANDKISESNFISLNELRINDMSLIQIVADLISKKKLVELLSLECEIPDFESQFQEVFQYQQKERRVGDLEFLISYESLQLYPDYQNKINVLRALKYIDDEDMVEMKGKVACGMGSHELIITELIFRNILGKFEPSEIAALLSCLVFQVKTDDNFESELTSRLKEGIHLVEEVHAHIRVVERNFADETTALNFGLVFPVYEWAHGKPFAEIMNLVEGKVQEGIIVRCIQQLNEILGNIKDAAKLFGDPALKKKMEEASEAIKRDIVFAASLYTNEKCAT